MAQDVGTKQDIETRPASPPAPQAPPVPQAPPAPLPPDPGRNRWLLWLCLGGAALALLALALRLLLAPSSPGGKEGGQLGGEPPKRTQPPYTVVIDPGHGGSDTGAQALIRESDTNWQTATVLAYLLESEGNGRYNVVLTKEYDADKTPRERAQVGVANDADLFIAIHCNSAANPKTKGFECYPIPEGRPWHELSMQFGRLAAQRMASMTALRGTDGLRYAYYVGDEKHIVELKDGVPAQYGTFTVLEESGCPAVLCEQCFVTNEEDADTFGSENGAWLVARCYMDAIGEYFDWVEQEYAP